MIRVDIAHPQRRHYGGTRSRLSNFLPVPSMLRSQIDICHLGIHERANQDSIVIVGGKKAQTRTMLRDILLLFALTAATLSQVGKISQIGKPPTSPSFRQSLSNPDMPSSPADPEVPSSLSSSTFSASTVSSASPTSSTRRGKGDPDAWKTGYPERDWHKTCLPCYGNAALVDGHLLQLGCSDNNSTDYDEFTSFSELDLDLCLTNNDGVINNFDNNTLKPITGHQRHPK